MRGAGSMDIGLVSFVVFALGYCPKLARAALVDVAAP
jgi:hypothetical protein